MIFTFAGMAWFILACVLVFVEFKNMLKKIEGKE